MLNRFVVCVGADSSLDIDGLYFLQKHVFAWSRKRKTTGLMAATILKFNDLARTLLHYDANINVRNEDGFTALIYAAAVGNARMVGILLGLGANVNGATNFGVTPLHAAAIRGHLRTVRLLLRKGADVNRIDDLDMIAANKDGSKIMALLQRWGR